MHISTYSNLGSLKLAHFGSIYTTDMGKHYKNQSFSLESQLLNINNTTEYKVCYPYSQCTDKF